MSGSPHRGVPHPFADVCPPLPPEVFFSPEVFAREQERLFGRLWVFAALARELAAKNAFVTLKVGHHPVLVQNVDGELVALENVCRHRHMALQWEPRGQRSLVCRFHGWAYDGTGAVTGIPDRATHYHFSDEAMAGLRLRRFAVAQVGAFVFVNVAPEPIPLDEQFSPELQAELRRISPHFDGEVRHRTQRASCNWKLGYQNNFDELHVKHVHRGTFLKEFMKPAGSAGPVIGETAPPGIVWDTALVREKLAQPVPLAKLSSFYGIPFSRPLEARDWHASTDRLGDENRFHLWLLYPNVEIYSLRGHSFVIYRYNPVDPGHVELSVRALLTRVKPGTSPETIARVGPARAAGLEELVAFDRVVLDEDLTAAEQVQRSLGPATRPAFHGVSEYQLMRMAIVYRRLMGLEP